MLIYLVTNKVNGKRYIGQTIQTMKKRWSGHLSTARHGRGLALYNAIRKYGEESFEIEPLAVCRSKASMDAAERWFIRMYESNNPELGYNLSTGGEGRTGIHKSLSAEHKAKISKARKGQPNGRLGVRLTKETRWKISNSNKGRIGTRLGAVVSEETKQKLSSAITLYYQRKQSGQQIENA